MEVSGVYWRASRFSGAQCPPGLLSLADGRLSFLTADERVLDVPVDDVTGRWSGWGSLVVESSRGRIVFVDSVGAYGTPFTPTQRRVVAAAKAAGTLRSLPEWPAIVTAAGGSMTASRVPWRRILLIAIGVVLVGGAAAAWLLSTR